MFAYLNKDILQLRIVTKVETGNQNFVKTFPQNIVKTFQMATVIVIFKLRLIFRARFRLTSPVNQIWENWLSFRD